MKKQQLFSQSWAEVTSGERNAIVFEHMNQSYGAYEIRENYDRTLLKTFFGMTLLVVLFSFWMFLSALCRGVEKIIPPLTTAEQIFILPNTNELEIPKVPEQRRTHAAPVDQNDLPPVVTTEPADKDPITPDNKTTLSSTGTPVDSTGSGSEMITNKWDGEKTLPAEILTMGDDLDVIPHFPGGEERLSQFLRNNLHIPQELIEIGGVREKVGVAFVVDQDGSIINAVILQNGSRYMQLNNEAMRVMKKMPKWEPGRQNGNPVKVQMVLPIRFEVK
ncbi:MAG: TonB family protein [Bacteroidetes bacterium]|nr:TonB family protein [Bacteroidota bacterium]